jgi:hypothetical protein
MQMAPVSARVQLGSNSDVKSFRVQFGDELLVKRFELAKPAHLLDLGRVRTPICGPHPNENACLRPETLEVVGVRCAWVDLHH